MQVPTWAYCKLRAGSGFVLKIQKQMSLAFGTLLRHISTFQPQFGTIDDSSVRGTLKFLGPNTILHYLLECMIKVGELKSPYVCN